MSDLSPGELRAYLDRFVRPVEERKVQSPPTEETESADPPPEPPRRLILPR